VAALGAAGEEAGKTKLGVSLELPLARVVVERQMSVVGAGVFHHLTPAFNSCEYGSVRLSFQVWQQSTACEVRGALQYSNDGLTWDAVSGVDGWGEGVVPQPR
jgi:hypothetical protein